MMMCNEEPVIVKILQNIVFVNEDYCSIMLHTVDRVLPDKVDDVSFVLLQMFFIYISNIK